jgi:glycerate kinase
LQIKDAIHKGAKEIIVGLGGSATNDGGTGIAQALGYTFLDINGKGITIKGEVLSQIKSIKKPASLKLPHLYAVNDVDNILTGIQGAAHTYGGQKGASPQEIERLDKGLLHLSEIVQKDLQQDEANTSGSGAAGGSGYGLRVFGNASFIPGVDFLAKVSGIAKALEKRKIDLIITGEGSIDNQTHRGKLVKGVAALGAKYKIPVIALCGINQLDEASTQSLGLQKVFAVADSAKSKEDSIKNAGQHIKSLASEIYDYWQER